MLWRQWYWSSKFILLTRHPFDKIMLQEALLFLDMNCTHYTKQKSKQTKTTKHYQDEQNQMGESLFKIIHSSMKYSYRKYINTFFLSMLQVYNINQISKFIQWPTNNRTSKYIAACQLKYTKKKTWQHGAGKIEFQFFIIFSPPQND